MEESRLRENLNRPQVEASHYDHHYNTKERLASFWHQVEETLAFQPKTVMEVGVGSGFTSAALRREGIQVLTLDVDAALGPDIVGGVGALPVQSEAVDVVVCCQVLEHLPFEEFPGALRELTRVASKGIVLSLPDQERYLKFSLATNAHRFSFGPWDVPRPAHRRPQQVHPEHYWEIGCREIVLATVCDAIRQATGCPPKTYRVFEFPYHRFFILDKINGGKRHKNP